jgi:hypothetical protein
MKILLSQVTEPQICFPSDDGGTICNWVKKGLYAISSKNGWMKIPPEESEIEEEVEQEGSQKKEEAPSLAAERASSKV